MESLIPAYVEALCDEIRHVSRCSPEKIPIHTIFFGGGTPSLLARREIERVFATAEREFELLNGLEVTLEANPGKLSLGYLKSIRELGVNRISLGMQSANPEELLLLERQHVFKHVVDAVCLINKAGIENFNLDIIFGIPYQSVTSFQRTIELGISLDPDHFSLYALTVESGTPLGSWVNKGLITSPDPDLAADMYELASQKLDAEGYEQYEISNWARRDKAGSLLACQHNLQYWRNLPYLGCGAGAHGFVGGERTENVLDPMAYIQRFKVPAGTATQQRYPFPRNPATEKSSPINQDQEMKETMLMGLRLTEEGVSSAVFRNRFGEDFKEVYQLEIDQLIGSGLLEYAAEEGDRLRLTPRGRLLGNQVFVNFI